LSEGGQKHIQLAEWKAHYQKVARLSKRNFEVSSTVVGMNLLSIKRYGGGVRVYGVSGGNFG
jgi:hypothetical protein